MSSELTILAFSGLLTVLVVLLSVLTALPQAGLMTLSGTRENMEPLTGMAGRVERTLNNTVVALVLFAPAILVLHASGGFTGTTLLAAQIFLIARVLYVPIYVLPIAVPLLRTVVWMAGFLATALLYILAL